MLRLAASMNWGGWSTVLLVVNTVIILVLVPRIVVQRRESAATLAWVFFIFLLPLGGALLYHLLGTRRLRHRRQRRAYTHATLASGTARVGDILRPYRFKSQAAESASAADHEFAQRVFLTESSPATTGNTVNVYAAGPEAFAAIEAAVASARQHVHVLVYIFQPDITGRRLLSLLTERARAGVEVRLLVDAVGSRCLRAEHTAALREAGGQVVEFLPINVIVKPFSVNFRNHRKIIVVDGDVAFTGGMNIGDEYQGRRRRNLGAWRDTHLRLQGPAARRLQEVFADDWHYATNEDCMDLRYFPPPTACGSAVVQVVASGPDGRPETIHRSFFSAITGARERVWLTTPYFVPDRSILVALTTAALQGVDVRLLLPGASDHVLALYAGRSHYYDLLAAGARIYEYTGGFLHAKTMVVDQAWTALGSANMDVRSFALNWEANIVAYDRDLAATVAETFRADCAQAREIKRPLTSSNWQRFQQAGSYLLSPLL